MVSQEQVVAQLERAGCNFRFWGRSEVGQLRNILVPGETIKHCVNGRYENGFAMLCVTDHRLLLVDHKPLFLTVEDLRFDMIAEIDYSWQLLAGTVYVITTTRKLRFVSWSQYHLREVVNYTQQQIMAIRQQYLVRQFQQPVDDQTMVASLGSLASQPGGIPWQQRLPLNPYANGSLILRRSRIPKFY